MVEMYQSRIKVLKMFFHMPNKVFLLNIPDTLFVKCVQNKPIIISDMFNIDIENIKHGEITEPFLSVRYRIYCY